MPNYYVGKNRTELIDWLLQTWLKGSSPVCFVEGFSGVGKTSVARTVIKNSGMAAVMIDMPEASADQTDNLFLNLATELSQIDINDLADAVTEGKSIDKALRALLNKPILVVIDEFQRAISNESGKPTDTLLSFLGRLGNRPNMPGRVLLLTNHIVERSKWSEAYEIRTLNGLSPLDAEELLGKLLKDKGRTNEISRERRPDVVNWLGCNPRAIQVLVASLEKSSLDELIGISPETWEARDREVSAELLHKLESELLERTIELLLKAETATLLRRLSVHRKTVKREAIEILLQKGVKFEAVRDDLINRFLMEQHSGWFSLNPVVREISLQRLKGKPAELKQAHARAADYYMRHFKAREIVDSGKLGGYFVEARYHLVQAQLDEELGQIAGRFENHLKARFSSTDPVPRQLDELNERIATLIALLETPGAKGLEFYLARLYEARGAPGDLQKALVYSERATGKEAPVQSWLLRLRLEAKNNGPAQIGLLAREAITRIPADRGVEQIYLLGAELLAQAGRIEDAIILLKDGISKVPADKGVFSLYQSAGELLAKVGRIEEALTLLKDGISKIPADKGVMSLYQSAAELLAQTGRTEEALALLQDGISKVPVDKGVSALYQSAGELLAQTGRIEEALALLQDGIIKVPADMINTAIYISTGRVIASMGKTEEAIDLLLECIARYPSRSVVPPAVFVAAGELLVQAGRTEEALTLLKDGISKVPADKGVFSLYQSAGELLAQTGRTEEALTLLKDGISKVPADKGAFSLYQSAGELLAQTGRIEEAISLLKDGIIKIPADKGAFSVYQSAGELLAQTGRIEEAISLLKDGIIKVPADKGVVSLYQSAGELLAQAGRIEEAISLLKDGMVRIPSQYTRSGVIEPILSLLSAQENIQALDDFLSGSGKLAVDPPQIALGKVLRSMILREWETAAQLARQESLKFPKYRQLQQLEVFCRLSINQVTIADEVLQKIDFDKDPHGQLYWLKAWVDLKKGSRDEARKSLSIYLDRNAEENEVSERFLLELWDTVPVIGSRHDLAYFFPILPPSLTGLPNDLVRMQYGPSVIRHIITNEKPGEAIENSGPGTNARPKEEMTMKFPLKVFISYSHKDEVFKDELVTMLSGLQRRGTIDAWQDRRIEAGDEWYKSIQNAMNECDVAILLLSPDFIASRFIQEEELDRILERREEAKLRVIPIIVRPCMWRSEPFLGDLQALPKDGKAVITFSKDNGDRDQIWTTIAQDLERRTKK